MSPRTTEPVQPAEALPAPVSTEPLLALQGLTTVFPTAKGLAIASNGVSFVLQARETLGLVGESGSGKSVTCRSIIGLVPEPGRTIAGSVRFQGRELTTLSERSLRSLRG